MTNRVVAANVRQLPVSTPPIRAHKRPRTSDHTLDALSVYSLSSAGCCLSMGLHIFPRSPIHFGCSHPPKLVTSIRLVAKRGAAPRYPSSSVHRDGRARAWLIFAQGTLTSHVAAQCQISDKTAERWLHQVEKCFGGDQASEPMNFVMVDETPLNNQPNRGTVVRHGLPLGRALWQCVLGWIWSL